MRRGSHPLYRALAARDRRFDGIFFVGVTSTGVYCRPICPVRTPKEANCRFFRSPQEAEGEGFRPCLRCRPELAPGSAPIDDAQRIAQTIVRRIEENAADDERGIEAIAAQFELSSRQIRRIIRKELGVSPIQLILTRRLLLAKRLLTETRLPVTRIAFASGFASLRRFNDAFAGRYRMPPSRLRKSAAEGGRGANAGETSTLQLAYRPPYDWAGILAFLKARELKGVELVTDTFYARTVRLGDAKGWIKISQGEKSALLVEFAHSLSPALPSLLNRIRDLFDLDARPDVIHRHLRKDKLLRPLVSGNPGLRVPGAFDGFEMGWRAILGQQVTVKGATTIARRVVESFSEGIATPYPELNFLTPSPARLARAGAGQLARLGIVRGRCEGVIALSKAHVRGGLCLDSGGPRNPGATIAALGELPGVGPWTAQYLAMRALRWPDAFPKEDGALLNRLGGITAKQAEGISQHWRPWRSYAVLHLWNRPAELLSVRNGGKKMTYFYKTMKSPIGKLKLIASDKGLAGVLWENDRPMRIRLAPLAPDEHHPVLLEAERQLNDYFSGKRQSFSVKLDVKGTEFQKRVWAALLEIPFGETRSYGDIARQIRQPEAVRAVGAASGKNPVSIIAPCHRVIGSTGKLTGFAGGLETKARLLELERNGGRRGENRG